MVKSGGGCGGGGGGGCPINGCPCCSFREIACFNQRGFKNSSYSMIASFVAH